jgi:hypothetical protein
MIKLIATGVWVAIVTLGAVYGSIQLAKPEDPNAEAEKKKAVQELVHGEMVTLPVIKNADVAGYFLTKTSYIVDKSKMGEVTLPIPAVLTDELYTALVGDQVIRVGDNRELDVKAFRERIKTALNKRLGSEVVIDVVFEQIDYLSKEDLRQQRADKTQNIVHETPPADVPAGKAAEGGH